MTESNDSPIVQEEATKEPKEHQVEKKAVPINSATTEDVPSFGWSAYAERINGRFAMIGFAAVLLIEALSRDAFLHWAGLLQ